MIHEFDLGSLRYVVLPGSQSSTDIKFKKIYEQTYQFWLTEWEKIFKKIDPQFKINADDFSAQNKICAILHKDEVVGIQTLGKFTLDDFLSNPYFKPYTVDFLQNLVKQKIFSFQTMQYFLVNEKFSPRATGQNFAAIILGLSFMHQIFYRIDATITLARKDLAAASTARKFNMLQVGEDIKMHQVPVGQLLCTTPQPFPRNEVNQIVNELWQQRLEFHNTNHQENSNEQFRSFIPEAN